MTVRELILELSECDLDAQVVLSDGIHIESIQQVGNLVYLIEQKEEK